MIDCKIINSDNPLDQVREALRITTEINSNQTGELELNMQNMVWITPFYALLLSNTIVQRKGYNIIINPPKDRRVFNYLMAIGFPMNQKVSGTTYSPIHHFNKDASTAANHVYQLVDRTFPEVLSSGNAIKYIISELSDNLEEHSNFSQASIMAQCFQKKGFIDIGVIDNGISIPSSFEKIGLAHDTDCKAISMAIDGKSTKNQDGRGKGLSSTTKIIEQGFQGEYYIVSRQGLVLGNQRQGRKLYILENLKLNGTLVYMRFKIPQQKVNIYPYIQ